MAETRIANIVQPDQFTAYTMEASIYRNRFYRSGVIAPNPGLDTLLAGGGKTFNFPYWQDLDDTESGVPSETVPLTVSNIAADSQVAVRLIRERGFGANALSAVLSGDNPIQAIQERVIGYWEREYDKALIACALGVIKDNIAHDSGDLVVDVTGTANDKFRDDIVIDAQAKLGENGVVGREDSDDFSGIGVHPDVYAYMRKLDAIDFVAISGQPRPIPFYMGMEVVVDRRFPKVATSGNNDYTTLLFKRGAFGFGQTAVGYTPTEIDRTPGTGFGIDTLYTRRVFSIHPVGFEFLTGSVSGVSPTNTELALSANWSRVFNSENCRFVALIHNI